MAKNKLAVALASATRTAERFVNGETTALDFVSEYRNFYYFEALDGHEASSARDFESRARYWISIELHRRIQNEVIDLLSLDESFSSETLKQAGRIDGTEARERAIAICASAGLKSILEDLEGE